MIFHNLYVLYLRHPDMEIFLHIHDANNAMQIIKTSLIIH